MLKSSITWEAQASPHFSCLYALWCADHEMKTSQQKSTGTILAKPDEFSSLSRKDHQETHCIGDFQLGKTVRRRILKERMSTLPFQQTLLLCNILNLCTNTNGKMQFLVGLCTRFGWALSQTGCIWRDGIDEWFFCVSSRTCPHDPSTGGQVHHMWK